MRKLRRVFAAAVAFLLLFVQGAFAGQWTKKQVSMELVTEALLLADMSQTLTIAQNPDRFTERNPLLGKHPSEGMVHSYFIGWMIIHPLVAHFLPSKSKEHKWINRENWQYFFIGVEAAAVVNNIHVGIGFSF